MQNDFIRYCRANRLSEVSIKDYINSLDMVSRELLDKRFDESDPKEFINLTNDDYLKFVELQQIKGLMANTIKLRLNALKTLYTFLLDRGLITLDDAYMRGYVLSSRINKVKDKSVDKKVKHTLTEEEIERMMVAISQLGKNVLRRRLFLTLLLNNALRISELTEIKVGDVDLENSTIRIVGKGDKPFKIMIDDKVKSAIEKYMLYERRHYNNSDKTDYLFLTNRGTQLTPRHSNAEIKAICDKANINKNISCHRLRATTATLVYEKTGSIEMAQAVLGHSSPTTTRIYLDDELKNTRKSYSVL